MHELIVLDMSRRYPPTNYTRREWHKKLRLFFRGSVVHALGGV